MDLLDRARRRRFLAASALRQAGTKKEITPQELKQAIERVDTVQSIFGAPKDSKGNPVGKAGRTLAIVEKWLQEKDAFGLPPVGDAFKVFILRQLDKANYIWGHDEAILDVCRDMAYNFHFDPLEVVLIDQKERAPAPQEQVNCDKIPKVVSVKTFTKPVVVATEMPKDDWKIAEVPVVTRVDYMEDMEKAKEKGQLAKQPIWNVRNTGVNDLLEDLKTSDYDKAPEKKKPIEDDVKARPFVRDHRYSKEEGTKKSASIKDFTKKN